jgi:hypothetical protein
VEQSQDFRINPPAIGGRKDAKRTCHRRCNGVTGTSVLLKEAET